jgi:hypothetical protein
MKKLCHIVGQGLTNSFFFFKQTNNHLFMSPIKSYEINDKNKYIMGPIGHP